MMNLKEEIFVVYFMSLFRNLDQGTEKLQAFVNTVMNIKCSRNLKKTSD
jgi:hypothetical protein